MFDIKHVTIKIKTGSTYIVVPDVEIIYWTAYMGYDFHNDADIESFQLTKILLPAWAECFRDKIHKYISDNMKIVHKTKKGDSINVD